MGRRKCESSCDGGGQFGKMKEDIIERLAKVKRSR